MIKKTKLPKTHKALSALIEETRRQSYAAGFADGKTVGITATKQGLQQLQLEADRTRRDAIASLSRMGQATAEVAMSLSKVIEPRQT